MERVATLGRVLFVNDSMAASAATTAQALAEFSEIFWIVGGKPSMAASNRCVPSSRALRSLSHRRGDGGIRETLEGFVPFERCGVLKVATDRAAADAAASAAEAPVVLLSPACASYDQFASYEARGDAFRDFAKNLAALDQGDVP